MILCFYSYGWGGARQAMARLEGDDNCALLAGIGEGARSPGPYCYKRGASPSRSPGYFAQAQI